MLNTERLCMGCMNDNGGEKICPICGHDSSDDNTLTQLTIGTWLNANRFLVGRVIEEGGDGITYIGWDNDSNAVVNIREYFPDGLSVRSSDRMTVTPAAEKGMAFNKGMEEFVALFSKLSALPESAAILKIVDAFESNGTVYAVSQVVSGISLKAFLVRNGGSLKWEQVKPLFMPLLATVSELNDAGIIHRGISPETIIVGRDGKLRLTGFSIKEARVEHTDFIARLQSGYSSPEQYLENDDYSAVCDVYSLGAVMFRCLIGTTPPDAKERLVNDKLSISAKITETVPKGALIAVASTLKVDKTERTASVDRFRRMLEAVSSNTVILAQEENGDKKQQTQKGADGKKYAIIASAITAGIFLILICLGMIFFKDALFPTESEPVDASQQSSSMPDTPSVGDVDSTIAHPGEKLYVVPDYTGNTFNNIIRDENLSGKFEIVIAGTEYSNTVARGHVCKQTVAKGSEVARDTEIGVYISLGPSSVNMPNLVGMTEEKAYITLLEYGFFKSNIEFIYKNDDSFAPGTVIETSVKANKTVSTNDSITIYVSDATASSQDTSTEG
ncbi:MAG: PASTA domain-containing protein [Clostridia bacterium]|nr:PASTA domain-containing protein [Clostridia bacterium]